jgi:hypothetical protein
MCCSRLRLPLRIAHTQNQIQQRALQQDLFDKRYAVYVAIEEFLN